MKYASLFSGIEAASVAWKTFNMNPVFFSEVDDFCSSVLKKRFPSVPNLGDIKHLNEHELYNNCKLDLIIGGSPCQDFSTAGKSKGLNGENGKLTLEFCKVLDRKKPQWFVWENVTGVISCQKGESFRRIISEFAAIGYGVSWRVLDSQFFGVPQKRRRVYVVGYLGAWEPTREVLFEQESLLGFSGENRKKRKKSSAKNTPSTEKTSSGLMAYSSSGRGEGKVDLRFTESGIANTVTTSNGSKSMNMVNEGRIRILTPREREALMGLPKDWTKVKFKNKKLSEIDAERFKAIGNSMAVPVIRYLGKRILMVDNFLRKQK